VPWGNETWMRPVIAKRRARCIELRALGYKWREIALQLGYGSDRHARIDWLRAKKRIAARDNC
jgi:hypothetical protein